MNKIKLTIFGSCVSREMINYSDKFSVVNFIEQNPIHTIFSNGMRIKKEDCLSLLNINFIKQMVYYELNKKALTKLFQNTGDYFIIDFADCRFDYLLINNDVMVADTPNVRYTLDKMNIEYEKQSIHELTLEQWDEILNKFVDIILSHYPSNQIILNRVTFATTYLNRGKIVEINESNQPMECKSIPLIRMIEEMFIEKTKCVVIDPIESCISNYYQRFGFSSLHYLDSTYVFMALRLYNTIINKNMNSEIISYYDFQHCYINKSNKVENIKRKIDFYYYHNQKTYALDLAIRYYDYPPINKRIKIIYEDLLNESSKYSYPSPSLNYGSLINEVLNHNQG